MQCSVSHWDWAIPWDGSQPAKHFSISKSIAGVGFSSEKSVSRKIMKILLELEWWFQKAMIIGSMSNCDPLKWRQECSAAAQPVPVKPKNKSINMFLKSFCVCYCYSLSSMRAKRGDNPANIAWISTALVPGDQEWAGLHADGLTDCAGAGRPAR